MIGSMAMGLRLPGLTMAAQYSWKNMGMLADVTDGRRSWKCCCRGRLALGFKPKRGSHAGAFWDHAALGCTLFATWLRKKERLRLEEKG